MEVIKKDKKWVIEKLDETTYIVTYFEKFTFGWLSYAEGERYSKNSIIYEFGKKYAY